MAKKRHTSLVAFHCPHRLLTEIDDFAYINMMDRTEFIVAAVAKFVEFAEKPEAQFLEKYINPAFLAAPLDSEEGFAGELDVLLIDSEPLEV